MPDEHKSQGSTSDRDLINRAQRQVNSAAKMRKQGLIGTLAQVAASIPGYRMLGEANRGGQGVVYKAIQLSTKRNVAIKVLIDSAVDGTAEGVRFEREVHILAQLSHPHIVAVHDSGQSDGHFYCVMDFVTGESLDDFIENRNLSERDRLVLFAEICEAVNAAHLLGVIHRDLKPSNIRVDDDGHPHILDFGLAKIATGANERAEVMTMTGQFVGSLPWAAPEQADGGPSRIDTRTDVYSLGVIAYQMITGRFPYDVQGSMKQTLDNILEVEPAKLRTVSSTTSADVEAIIHKALAKEPERRYQTAGELARDARRFLASEPIEARRDSTSYVMRKMLHKHWPVVATGGVFVALVVGFGITMTVLYGVAERQREIAVNKTAEAEATADTIINAISAVRPDNDGDRNVLLRDALDSMSERAEEDLTDYPLPLARVHDMLGECFLSLAEIEKAEPSLIRALDLRVLALGENNRETIKSMNALGLFYKKNNRNDEAAPLFDRIAAALPNLPRGVPRDQRDIAAIHINLARWYESNGDQEIAATSYRAALADLKGVTDAVEQASLDRARAATAGHLGNLLRQMEQWEEAEQRLRECVDLFSAMPSRGEGHPETAIAKVKLGHLLRKQKNIEEAEQMYRDAIEVLSDKMGPGHPATLATGSHLYKLTFDRKDYVTALSIIEKIVDNARTTLGEAHAGTALYVGMLGACQAKLGDDIAARANLVFACKNLQRVHNDPCHPDCIKFMRDLIKVYHRLGDVEAESKAQAAIDGCEDD